MSLHTPSLLGLLLLWTWSLDRIEPPFAVLYDEEGREAQVHLQRLPKEVRPGDLLKTLTGPILPGRKEREAALRARLEALLSP